MHPKRVEAVEDERRLAPEVGANRVAASLVHLEPDKRREFYRIMLEDSDRLLHTIDQVLRAGSAGSRLRRRMHTHVNLAEITRESVALAPAQLWAKCCTSDAAPSSMAAFSL